MDVYRRIPALPRLLLAATIGAALLSIVHLKPFELGGAGLDGILGHWTYSAVFVIAAAACIARGTMVRRDRGAWIALGLSLALWGAGEMYWWVAINGLDPEPYPSLADGLWLGSYLPYYVAIVLFVRARVRHASFSMWLDGAIGGLAMAALAAAVLTPALVGLTKGSTAVVATNLAYPLADLILFGFVVGAGFVMAGRGGRQWTLVTAGLLTLGIADSIYLYQVAEGSYHFSTMLDALWLVNAALIAIAAWATPSEGTRSTRSRSHSLSLGVGFAAIAVVLLVYDLEFSHVSKIAEGLAIATLALTVTRLLILVRENSVLLEAVHHESVTDALTGLRNRRALVSELDRRLAAGRGGSEFCFTMFDLDGFKNYNDSYGHGAGDSLLRRLGQKLEHAAQHNGSAYRLGGDEFCTITDGPNDPVLFSALAAALSEAGDGFLVSSSCGTVELPYEAPNASKALKLADERMYASKRGRRNSAERQTRDVLLTAQIEREPGLGLHIRDVARQAAGMGRRLDLGAEEMDILVRAAELHDIGKIAIPEEILNSPHELNSDEWRLIRKHTEIGERILNSAPAMAPVAKVVRSTHERWDGTGYPDGLAAEAIPLPARIILLCDAFDAMVADRPYCTPKSPADALAEIRSHAGTQFDPRLAGIFCDLVADTLDEKVAGALDEKTLDFSPARGTLLPRT